MTLQSASLLGDRVWERNHSSKSGKLDTNPAGFGASAIIFMLE
jgi:hypothetical protein